MINPYYLFMSEAEGYLDTRESKLVNIIKVLKQVNAATVPMSALETACRSFDLDPASLTTRELDRIAAETRKVIEYIKYR